MPAPNDCIRPVRNSSSQLLFLPPKPFLLPLPFAPFPRCRPRSPSPSPLVAAPSPSRRLRPSLHPLVSSPPPWGPPRPTPPLTQGRQLSPRWRTWWTSCSRCRSRRRRAKSCLNVSTCGQLSPHLITFSSTLLPPAFFPRQIKIVGSDGRTYAFLAKPKDDLRKDNRMMALCGLLNRCAAWASLHQLPSNSDRPAEGAAFRPFSNRFFSFGALHPSAAGSSRRMLPRGGGSWPCAPSPPRRAFLFPEAPALPILFLCLSRMSDRALPLLHPAPDRGVWHHRVGP